MRGFSNTVIVIILFATSGALYAAYTMIYEEHKALPVLGPTIEDRPHEVEYFSFYDQTGALFNTRDNEGKVTVMNSFFTSCPTICPKMMASMERIQKATKKNKDELALISITVDPKRDVPSKLAQYAPRYNINYERWKLLTGDKKELYSIARKEYFLVATDGDGGPGDFIHSERLVLVDQDRHIRGYYDGTNAEEVNDLLRDLRKLLNK